MATGSLTVTSTPPTHAAPVSKTWNTHSEGSVKMRLAHLELPVEVQYNDLVLDRVKMYVTGGRRATENILGRTVLYFPVYEYYLRKYNLPESLKYLPMIESGLRPGARSQVGAVGMWQLMYSTGRHYGLTVNEYIDERRDPYRSTEAAVRLLADLYDMFGDWALVLAAYNGGPGRVQRAIEVAGCNDYEEVLPYLPLETRRYVPYFVAAAYIANHHLDHDLIPRLPEYLMAPTRTIEVHQHAAISELAEATGLSYSTISRLNPALLQGAIPRSQKGYYLVLPAGATTAARQYFARRAKRDPKTVVPANYFRYSHVVGEWETIEELARTFHCTVEDIMKWNNLTEPEVVVNQELDLYLSRKYIFNRA